MDLKKISAGSNIPEQINVLIEISAGANPVKYEFDKDSGAILVDRFLTTAMFYPANYGFIPHTLSDDGDPADVLVLSDNSIIPGAVVECRPIGVLMMEDEKGKMKRYLLCQLIKFIPLQRTLKILMMLIQLLLERLKHFLKI